MVPVGPGVGGVRAADALAADCVGVPTLDRHNNSNRRHHHLRPLLRGGLKIRLRTALFPAAVQALLLLLVFFATKARCGRASVRAIRSGRFSQRVLARRDRES